MDNQYFQTVGYLMGLINRTGHMYTNEHLKIQGIGRGQVPYLMELSCCNGVTQDYLAKKVQMDKSTVARAIKKLEAGGFVYRQQNPKDKRENLVYITDSGRAINPMVKALSGQWMEKMTKGLSEEELENLLTILEKMDVEVKDFRQKYE